MTLGAQAIQATLDLLAHFPDAPLRIDQRPGSIEIVPDDLDGFSVAIYDEGEEAMIAADRWHSHDDDPQQIAWAAYWLLTPYYRIVHEFKGGVLVAVWLERYEADGWIGFDPAFYLNPDDEKSWELKGDETFGRRYLQQAVLPSPQPYAEIFPGAALAENGLPVDYHAGKRIEQGGRTAQALDLLE